MPDLKKIVVEMFDLMYEHKGLGLAADQVDLPYRLFILNLEGDPAKAEEHVFSTRKSAAAQGWPRPRRAA